MALEGRYWNRPLSPRLPRDPNRTTLLFSCVLSRPLHPFTHPSYTPVFLTGPPPSLSREWLGLTLFVSLKPELSFLPRWISGSAVPLWWLAVCCVLSVLQSHVILGVHPQIGLTIWAPVYVLCHTDRHKCRFPDLVYAWQVDCEFTQTQRHRKTRPQEAAMRPHHCQPLHPLGPVISAVQSKQEAFLFGNTRGQRWKEEKVQNQKDSQDINKQGIPCVLSMEILLLSQDGPLVPSLEIRQMLLPSPTTIPHTPKRQEFVNQGLSVAHLPMACSWSSDWLRETGDPFPGRAVLRGTLK